MRTLSGNTGEVWFNGTRLATLKSIELKLTGNFEDVNFCGDPATHSAYTGYSGEGTISLLKADSTVVKMMAEAYKTGVMPEIKITTKLMDNATKKSERVSIDEVVVTEIMLAKFEAKALVEEEIPVKFAKYDLIESL